jgi:excinuclease ABC subunit C
VLALDCGQDFDPARDEEFFATIPPRSGVLLIEFCGPEDAPGAQPYIVRTADLRRAAERLLRAPEGPSKRLNLRDAAAAVRYRVTGSKFEQALVLYQQARERFPRRYRDFIRLRPPALLKVNLRNEYPRCYVTRRIFADGGCYFGPFASRKAAETFANHFLDLFKMRRCQIKIRRDPAFPGCIYSEMKMCLAPCFAGCTKEEYDVEVVRVVETLASSGAALETELERERDAASEALDFERAAAIQKKIEKVSGILRGLPELARRVDELDAAILQKAAEEDAVTIFAVRGGMIADPLVLRFGELSSQPRSAEEILREYLEPPFERTLEHSSEREANSGAPEVNVGAEHAPPVAPPSTAPSQPGTRGESSIAEDYRERFGLSASHPAPLGENLALLARWFYSKPREGEIFFSARAAAGPSWPYRRIIRACSRLLHPQQGLPFTTPPAP